MGWLKGRVTADSNGNVFKAKGVYVNRDREVDPECVCNGSLVIQDRGRTIPCPCC